MLEISLAHGAGMTAAIKTVWSGRRVHGLTRLVLARARGRLPCHAQSMQGSRMRLLRQIVRGSGHWHWLFSWHRRHANVGKGRSEL